MALPPCIHLRATTPYSLLEGALRPAELAALSAEHDLPAVGVADRDSLAGAMEFAAAAVKCGVQPIVGANLALAEPGRPAATGRVVLFAKNEAGWRNLLALSSCAYLEPASEAAGPSVTLARLKERADGLICLTGGAEGALARTLIERSEEAAEKLLEALLAAFGDRLYMELHRHGLAEEDELEPLLCEFARAKGVPLVAANRVLFRDAAFHEAHEALLAVAAGRRLHDEDRPRSTPAFRFLPPSEMAALFADLPEALANTLAIARRCAFYPRPAEARLPDFSSARESEDDRLKRLAEEGLAERLARRSEERGEGEGEVSKGDGKERETGKEKKIAHVSDATSGQASAEDYRRRLAYELGVIAKTGFSGYFLIVADFVQWARAKGIPVGPGRGSGGGSAVAWSLKITDLDPLRWGLVFERFLNPERVSMPDFDIDFCQERRDQVLEYVRGRYGAGRVAHIGTYGTLQARAAIRDVGRVLAAPYPLVDKMCRIVPDWAQPADDAEAASGLKAAASSEEMRELVAGEPLAGRLLSLAERVEGLYRHASTHAAGVVISHTPLEERVPLFREPRAEAPVTQYSMKWVEAAGLVKFDFLGLNTLTILADAEEMIRREEPDFNLEAVPLDDEATYAMLGRGDTAGVFQMASGGMKDVAVRARPECLEDIIALIALYRPGPMENIGDYVAQKSGTKKIRYLHPGLEPILKETYGIIVYQEQVLRIARDLAGYSLGDADILRRAMGKKIPAEMRAQEETFVSGAVARGMTEKVAGRLFQLIGKFAGYGFNKAHATGYAVLAYRTAYLKARYPAEFFAALITHEMRDANRIDTYRQELARRGIPLLPPDMNRSGPGFRVETLEGSSAAPSVTSSVAPAAGAQSADGTDGTDASAGLATDAQAAGQGKAVRYGIAAVRNVGQALAAAITQEREAGGPFASLEDFAGRMHEAARRAAAEEAQSALSGVGGAASNAPAGGGAHLLNKRALEALAASGAFDSIAPHRRAAFDAAQSLAQAGAQAPQLALLDEGAAGGGPAAGSAGSAGAPWLESARLQHEFEALGLYLSSHPLTQVGGQLAEAGVMPWSRVAALAPEDCDPPRSDAHGQTRQEKRVILAGVLIKASRRRDKRGRTYATLRLSDPSGTGEITLFSAAFEAHRGLLEAGRDLVVDAVAEPSSSGEGGRVTGFRVRELAGFLAEHEPASLRLHLAAAPNGAGGVEGAVAGEGNAGAGEAGEGDEAAPGPLAAQLSALAAALEGAKAGRGVVELVCAGPEGGRAMLRLKERYTLDHRLQRELAALEGVRLEAGASAPGGGASGPGGPGRPGRPSGPSRA